jgi:hypothetical protein
MRERRTRITQALHPGYSPVILRAPILDSPPADPYNRTFRRARPAGSAPR